MPFGKEVAVKFSHLSLLEIQECNGHPIYNFKLVKDVGPRLIALTEQPSKLVQVQGKG